jgi:hypothetical protein
MRRTFDFDSRPGIAVVRADVAKDIARACKAPTPPEEDWTAEDLANQKRVADDVERALERHYAWMVIWVCVFGIAVGVAIHFLSTP